MKSGKVKVTVRTRHSQWQKKSWGEFRGSGLQGCSGLLGLGDSDLGEVFGASDCEFQGSSTEERDNLGTLKSVSFIQVAEGFEVFYPH